MLRQFYKILLFLISAILLSGLLRAQETRIIYLSGTDAAHTVLWDFFCTDGRNSGKWTRIRVPSNWELEGFGTYNYGHDWSNKEKKLGKEHGLYRYSFEVPASFKGKAVNIVFDGSMTDTEVKINGQLAGQIHQGAFYRFKYDISRLLKYGKSNLLEVDVAKHSANESVNRAERQADFWIFGGIFRPVYLEVLPAIHMKRAAIDAKADGSFNSLIILNDSKAYYSVSVELYDLSGKKVGESDKFMIEKGTKEKWLSGKFTGVKSWNPEWPVLYDMKIVLRKGEAILHEVTDRIGFRTVELREHDGFYINDEKVVFKGVNRHSFWPETGRALSDKNHLEDIRLIKEMNMNAVRCSHYVPDKRFLDLCDSLGLFILDEVTGWQDAYDTIVGPELIREAVLKDENHPSVVIWDHGNEGGWDFANEKAFHKYDIQKRPVIYPWLLRNGVDTHHYPEYDYAIGRFINGNDPFMPTEFLHGLYDGGSGAGLDDFWSKYETSPLHAGGFLWAFCDEAVLRTDREGLVYDSDGNHGPDGILGPHREKEGSFYTIKEIWSPVQVEPVTINRQWNVILYLTNKFNYTNLKDCIFTWHAYRAKIGSEEKIVTGSGNVASPDAFPGETRQVKVRLKNALNEADIFEFKAVNHDGQELYTWSWPVIQPDEKSRELQNGNTGNPDIKIEESENTVNAITAGIKISFDKENGTIMGLRNKDGNVSFSNGPLPEGIISKVNGTKWYRNEPGNFIFEITYSAYPGKIIWTVHKNGLLELEVSPNVQGLKNIDFLGVSFKYPEEKCTGITWMGLGPYRIWKNRLKGNRTGIWHKDYNNTITGESFNNLIYPEFKGYHGNLFWAKFYTTESDFTVISETPDLFFQLFQPGKPQNVAGGTYPPFPKGNISFLYEIPAIGTKFKQSDQLGPQGQRGIYGGHSGDQNYTIKLWFDFRSGKDQDL
jgi:hypothetical protein